VTSLLAAVALAAPGTERAAWPALPLEQPVVLARGWWQASAGYVREEWLRSGVGVDGRLGGTVEARYGVSEQLELSLVETLVASPDTGRVTLDPPTLGGRWRLAGREGPGASAAVLGALRPPWVDGTPALTVGVAAMLVTAPVRWSAEGGATWSPRLGGRDAGERLWADGRALLQVGPVAPWLGASVAAVGPARPDTGFVLPGGEVFGTAGLQVNASRGLAAWTEFRGSIVRTTPLVATAGRGLALGVRVAW
jgi:hypothetical protein